MATQLLSIKDLSVGVEEKEILHSLNLDVNKGETHVLMGPNGAGKSTLGYALMGNPKYEIKGGHIYFNGKDITEESPEERARDGIFLSFQSPIEAPGITLGNFIRTALEQRTGNRIKLWGFRKELKKAEDVEKKRKELQDDYREKFANPYRAAELGYVDEIIEPSGTRARLIRSFELLANKRQSNPPKKHSNLPL